jgi:hypothetical protein
LIAASGGEKDLSSIFPGFDVSIECLLAPWTGSDVSLGLLGRLFIEWRTASARPKIVKETNQTARLVRQRWARVRLNFSNPSSRPKSKSKSKTI